MGREMDVDVAVLGAGSAGMSAYRAATQAGARAVLVEQTGYGTTCARVGCMPSKLLIAAAEAAHAREAGVGFGLPPMTAPAADGLHAVMERVRRERDRFVGFVLREVEGYPAPDRLLGAVRFVDDHVLEVATPGTGMVRVHAQRLVIATGSSPVMPRELAEVQGCCCTTDELFDLPRLPRSAAIVGTGVIALEIGQALHRLGVRVRLFGRGGRLGLLTDPQLLPIVLDTWRGTLPLEHDARACYAMQGSGVRVRYRDAAGAQAVEDFDRVIVAGGRRPNLGVDGVERTRWGAMLLGGGGDVIDRRTMQLGDAPVFVAGDAAGGDGLLHEAVDEGRIAGRNAGSFPEVSKGSRRARLSIAFTSPQMVTVGGGWGAIAAGGGPVNVGHASFVNQGRSRVGLRNQGALHVYADDEGKFLGAEMLGPDAEHLGHLMAWALQADMSVEQMLAMPYYHPTVQEGLRTALKNLRVLLRRGEFR